VQEELIKNESTGYTTVLKLLQIMTEKRLVVRDEAQRAHIYSAHHSATHTQRSLVGDLLNRAFEGSAGELVLQALSTHQASVDERQEIRRLLDRMDREDTGRTSS
jgi:predicted transcriptional regulator